ncbi:MAG: hypothetical protein OEV87_11945 [Phycisphaerae bacterium]|nr:hypothetical protein [Phycisphaerae bacterium]
MKKRRKKTIWVVVLMVILYFFLPLPFVTEDQKIAIQQAALYSVYNRGDFGQKESVKTLFVNIGEGEFLATFFEIKENGSVFKIKDPSRQVIQALNGFPVEIRSGSEFVPTDPNWVSVVNERGERGILLGVGPIIKSLGLARCRTYYDAGPLNAAEYESFFIWTPFGWKNLFSFPYMKS